MTSPIPRECRALAIATAVLVLAIARDAAAQNQAADAEGWIRHGIELRLHNDDAAALAEFQRAWQATHSSRALAQMGLAEQALGRWLDADQHLREALATTGNDWIDRNRSALENSMRIIASHVGRLEVSGTPAGAEVRINNRPVGTLPLLEPLRLIAESVRLGVSAPGYYPVTRTISVLAGSLARETVDLEHEPPPAPASASPPPLGASVSPASPSPASPPPPAAPASAPPPAVAVVEPRGRLIVDSSEPMATVVIDGHNFGAGHVEQVLPIGDHRVEIRAPGYRPYQRTVNLEAQGLLRIDASLQHNASPVPTVVGVIVGVVVVGAAAGTIGYFATRHPDPLYVPSLGNHYEQ